MSKKILFILFVIICFSANSLAADIVKYYPEGWPAENVTTSVIDQNVIRKGCNVETLAFPPYYHACFQGQSVLGSSILKTIVGFFDPQGGWMVKSPGPHRTAPTNIIPNISTGWTGAFYGFTNLKKLILPPTISCIESLAFDGCSLNELVCMAVTPPKLEQDAFKNATIGKIVVPTGTAATYSATIGWNTFVIVEGAENYSENQMIEYNGAWYEVVNGEAALVNTDEITDPHIPNEVTGLIKGEWKTIPVTSIRPWSVNHDIVLNARIKDVPNNWRDGYNKTAIFSVSPDHPTLSSPAPNIITNKNGQVAQYMFNDVIVPHGVTSIANNALTLCTKAYLPTTLTFIGQQSNKTSELYFSSVRPPSTSLSSFNGRVYAPKEYLKNYTGIFATNSPSPIPAGYEYIESIKDDGTIFATGYWNVSTSKCILTSYSANESEANNVLNLPTQLYYTETMQGQIVEYRINDFGWGIKLNILIVPEGGISLTKLNCNYINELYLPSTLKTCCNLSSIRGLKTIKVSSGNTTFDSRDNCNAVIETATNTLVTGNCGTIIPSTTEHIADSAFYSVGFLATKVEIPSHVKTIGKHAFLWSQSIAGEYSTGSLQVDFSNASALKSIADSAFYNSGVGEYIALPNSLEELGEDAFGSCYELKGVTFGNSLKEINQRAFKGCNLTSLVLPNGIEAIGYEAFYGMPTLASITFGSSLKRIEAHAFSSCGLTNLVLPSGLEFIGKYAFSESPSLTSIDFGKAIRQIDDGAFKNCAVLEAVSLPSSIRIVGEDAFDGCNNIKELVLPMDSIVSIGRNAFYTCPSPEVLNLPASLTKIYGNSINLEATKIINIDSPTGIDQYGHNLELVNLEKIVIGKHKKKTSVLSYDMTCPNLKEFIIGESVDTITPLWNLPITSITIPKSVKVIIKEAFSGCKNLQEVNILDLQAWCNVEMGYNTNPLTIAHKLIVDGKEITDLVIPEGVKCIKSYTFDGCTGLLSVTLPKSTNQIDVNAFFGCENLLRINIPSLQKWCETAQNGGAFSTPYHLFFNGEELKEIIIPDGIDSLQVGVFYNCEGIKSVKIPNGVKKILRGAFYNCKNLEKIEIGSNVTYIGGGAFQRMDNLKEVYCYSKQTPLLDKDGEGIFTYTPIKDATLYVPAGTKNRYANASDWSRFGNIVELPDDPSTITAKDYTIFYGDKIAIYEYTSEGAELRGTPSVTCVATEKSAIGTYPIIVSKGTLENSNVTFVNGTLTIEKAPLKITAKDYTIKQGDPLPTFEATYEGFKNNETSAVLTKQPTITTTATSASVPGDYEIIVSGAEAQNYEISYVNGKLTIEAGSIIPVTEDEEISFGEEITEETGLSNTVIENTYYNMDAENGDGYNATEQALVLNSTTTAEQMSAIQNAEVGEAAISENYNGVIFEIAAGPGKVTVDAKTIGTHVLSIQIGKGEPTKVTKTERGTVDVPFNVTEPTYVYLYASTAEGSAARLDRAPSAAANSVLLYGYKVTLGGTGIEELKNSRIEGLKYYDLNGRKVNTPSKGIYILNGKRVMVK